MPQGDDASGGKYVHVLLHYISGGIIVLFVLHLVSIYFACEDFTKQNRRYACKIQFFRAAKLSGLIDLSIDRKLVKKVPSSQM